MTTIKLLNHKQLKYIVMHQLSIMYCPNFLDLKFTQIFVLEKV